MSTLLASLVIGLTLGPTGFYQMCQKTPDQCIETSGTVEPSAVLLSKVNVAFNAAIKPTPESGDTWSVRVTSGDCEDYALTKRAYLISKGVPSSSVRLATGWTRDTNEYHAVLVVSTPKGDMVLDNRTDKVLPVGKAMVRLVSVQSENDPRMWLKLKER